MNCLNPSMNAVTPGEVMSILHLLCPETRYASLEMLKMLYEAHPNAPEVCKAQLALKTAVVEWDDDDVADFLFNYLFQPPQATDLKSKQPQELRQFLARIYSYLFGIENSVNGERK